MPTQAVFRRLYAVVGLILAIALLAACGGGDSKPAPTSAPAAAAPVKAVEPTAAPAPTQAPQPTATAAPAPTATPEPTAESTVEPEPTAVPEAEAPTGQAALDLFKEVAAAQAAQKTMRMTMTSEKNGKVTETVMELIRPDRLKSSGGPGGDMIIIPEGTYMRETGGEWIKAPFDLSGSMNEMLSMADTEELLKYLNIDNLHLVGGGIVDGRPCWIYEYETTIKVTDITMQTQAKIWLGIADKLAYKSESVTQSSADPAGATTTTTVLYEYGLDLEIEAPIP